MKRVAVAVGLVFVVVASVVLGLFFYKKHVKKAVSCSQYAEFLDKIIPCGIYPSSKPKFIHTVAKVVRFYNDSSQYFLEFQTNTSQNTSIVTTAQLGFANSSELHTVETVNKKIFQEQYLQKYQKIPLTEAVNTLQNSDELYFTVYRSDEPSNSCETITTDLFIKYINNPTLVNYIKYFLNAQKCPLRISQIYY